MNARTPSPEDFLYDYQRPLFESRARMNLALFSRQAGKDFTVAMRGVKRCLRERANNYVFAPTERQSLEHFEKAKAALEAYGVAIANEVEEFEYASKESRILSKTMELANGSRFVVMPGSSKSARGMSGSIVITEFCFFDDQRDFWAAVFPIITAPSKSPKIVDVITTPNGKGDLVHQWWRECHDEKTSSAWACFFTDIHIAAAEWERRGRLPQGFASAADYVAFLRASFSEDHWAQEYECRFIDSTSVLIPYEMIAACESDDAARELDWARLRGNGEFYVGMDVGRRHDLTVFWIRERDGDRFVTRGVVEFRNAAFREQLDFARALLRNASVRKFAGDATGIGMQLCETLAEEFGTWRVLQCMFTPAFKQEIFQTMRTRFEDKTEAIPAAREIREDIRALQKTTTSAGTLRYAAASTPDGHSDRATALALSIFASKDDRASLGAECPGGLSERIFNNKYSAWRRTI